MSTTSKRDRSPPPSSGEPSSSSSSTGPLSKRRKLSSPAPADPYPDSACTSAAAAAVAAKRKAKRDLLSPLSDEILLRILNFLPPSYLVALAPVSRRFYALTSDSQVWKALYYDNFVRPRALRIPGFRDGAGGTGAGATPAGFRGEELSQPVDWKKQYKVKHKWAGGRCTAWSLRLDDDDEEDGKEEENEEEGKEYSEAEAEAEAEETKTQGRRRMLIKIAGTTIITADGVKGLCAWQSNTMRRGNLLARVGLGEGAVPSCIAVEQVGADRGVLDVVLGFVDGSFGVWRLYTRERKLAKRYRHEKSSNGELVEIVYSHPYLLTATGTVVVSLYTFDIPNPGEEEKGRTGILSEYSDSDSDDEDDPGSGDSKEELPAPYLLTSLNSHTSRLPLALSIRRTALTTIASIAYTCSTLQGWAIGVQDLHVRQHAGRIKSLPEVTTTRIAYTTPMGFGKASHFQLTPPPTPRRQEREVADGPTGSSSSSSSSSRFSEPGPTCLRYTHPYLLATLPDNTLMLYMCTSNASLLSISPGIRLWGHTSGISDAQITRRGKVVSVSSRGGEMRAWELEGLSRLGSQRSVEIRPDVSALQGSSAAEGFQDAGDVASPDDWRKSVGFTDEVLVVLNEGSHGSRATMMVYDFR